MNLEELVGSGRKIALLTLPFLIAGVILNVLYPHFFAVGGKSTLLMWASLVILMVGVINWIWTVALILVKIPRKELITTGPYALVKHPLYAGVAWLVLPWLGFLLNTWLGVLLGLVVYIGTRMYAPEEEKILSNVFGQQWDSYCKRVKLPWI